MTGIEEYQNRKYVKTIKIGNTIFFIGLFFGFFIIGNIISLCGSIFHAIDSKKRIQLAMNRLENLTES